MELTKDAKEVYLNVRKLALSPNALLPNSMTIQKIPFSILWRPNNYRRRFEIKSPGNSGYLPTIGTQAKHTGLRFFRPSKNITLQIGRRFIVAIWAQNVISGGKETYLIQTDSQEALDGYIEAKKAEIARLMDIEVKKIETAGAMELSAPEWLRHEDWLRGEEFIEKIPKEAIIHAEIFKKVYEKGIEFFGGERKEPGEYLKTYITNRAIEKLAPSIAQEMTRGFGALGDHIQAQTKVMDQFTAQLALHLDVLNGINKSFKKFNGLLSQRKITEW